MFPLTHLVYYSLSMLSILRGLIEFCATRHLLHTRLIAYFLIRFNWCVVEMIAVGNSTAFQTQFSLKFSGSSFWKIDHDREMPCLRTARLRDSPLHRKKFKMFVFGRLTLYLLPVEHISLCTEIVVCEYSISVFYKSMSSLRNFFV